MSPPCSCLRSKEIEIWLSTMERSCSAVRLAPLCRITDQNPLLSSSQRWQVSRLVIGCAHYRGRKTRGCWKHWRQGIIKVLPLSFSKLHLETSIWFKAVTCFSSGWQHQMQSLQELIYILWHLFSTSFLSFCGSTGRPYFDLKKSA